jgi:16S rRNA (cytosine967-C5)-methyltransferase
VASPERRLALSVLRAIDNGRTLGDELARPAVDRLPPRDRAFLHELVLGTLRHRGFLDHALASAVDRTLDRVEEGVLTALRLGAYQILKLRVPDHAAVSETVDVVRESRPQAAGFTNAVLRRLVRQGAPPLPDPARDPLGWLTSEGSLPRWLAERWVAREGADVAVRRARALLEPAPLTYRVNPHRADAVARIEEAGLEPRALSLDGTWEATAGRPVDLARDGLLYLQDLGSQVVARLAAVPGCVLDACAAPGGKSTLMADLHPGARVAALERSPRRLRVMARLVAEWGAANVRCVAGDALHPPFAAGSCDVVLLDAPCSGLGTLARNPDIRWRATVADVARHAEHQGRLIAAVADLVRPGGRLVYSACTLEPEETQGVVDAFLARRPDFAPAALPDWAARYADAGRLKVRPEEERADGFFAAMLVRDNGGRSLTTDRPLSTQDHRSL